MNAGWILALALASGGVDYGWQPAENGGNEYVLQLDGLSLGALKDGAEVTSAIPQAADDIRQLRIRVGRETLPQTSGSAREIAPLQYVSDTQTAAQSGNPYNQYAAQQPQYGQPTPAVAQNTYPYGQPYTAAQGGSAFAQQQPATAGNALVQAAQTAADAASRWQSYTNPSATQYTTDNRTQSPTPAAQPGGQYAANQYAANQANQYGNNQYAGGTSLATNNQQQQAGASAPPLLGPQNSVLQPNSAGQSQSTFSQFSGAQQNQQSAGNPQFTPAQPNYGSYANANQQVQAGNQAGASSGWNAAVNDPARQGYGAGQPVYTNQQGGSNAPVYNNQQSQQPQQSPQQPGFDLRGSTLTVSNNPAGNPYAQQPAQPNYAGGNGAQTGVLQPPPVQPASSPYANVNAPRYDAGADPARTGQLGQTSNWGADRTASAGIGSAQGTAGGQNAAAPGGAAANPLFAGAAGTATGPADNQNRMIDYQQPLAGGQNGAPLASTAPLGAPGAPGAANFGTAKAPGEIDPDKPWLPLMLSMLLLFGSLGANMYLGWIAFESHFRYRKALVEGDYDERTPRSRVDDERPSRRRD